MDDYYQLVLEKEVLPGGYSSFQGVKISMRKKDKKVVNIFELAITTDLNAELLSKEKAINIAKTFGEDNGWGFDGEIRLEVVRPNYMWYDGKAYNSADFSRLAWTAVFNNGKILLNIDVEDGAIIGEIK